MNDLEVIRAMFERANIQHQEQAEFYPMTLQPNGNTIIWIPGASLTFSEDGSFLRYDLCVRFGR